MIVVYHVNFHTLRKLPIFLDDEKARAIAGILSDIVERHHIVRLAMTVMPTHVHCVFVAFPDQTRGDVVQLLKGASAREFLARFPDFAGELAGHLWSEGYQWVAVESHRQLVATIRYVDNNRVKIGLEELDEGLIK